MYSLELAVTLNDDPAPKLLRGRICWHGAVRWRNNINKVLEYFLDHICHNFLLGLAAMVLKGQHNRIVVVHKPCVVDGFDHILKEDSLGEGEPMLHYGYVVSSVMYIQLNTPTSFF